MSNLRTKAVFLFSLMLIMTLAGCAAPAATNAPAAPTQAGAPPRPSQPPRRPPRPPHSLPRPPIIGRTNRCQFHHGFRHKHQRLDFQ